jgi:hypothetical protein
VRLSAAQRGLSNYKKSRYAAMISVSIAAYRILKDDAHGPQAAYSVDFRFSETGYPLL